MNRVRKPARLTPAMLQTIIEQEIKKFGKMEDPVERASDTEETDADELAGSLDKHIDYVKALKIEEGRLRKRLSTVRGTLTREAQRLIDRKIG